MSGRRKHSMRPWYVDRARVRSDPSDLLAIYAANGDKLAVLTDDSSKEWWSNAQLIAAALELLAEAEAALSLMTKVGDLLAAESKFKSSVVIARFKAIITKARGNRS